MMVLDSRYSQAQIHFRTQEIDINGIGNDYYNMYRTGMDGNSFNWKYYPNCDDKYFIPDNNIGYSNVMSVAPTTRPSTAEYDLTVHGSVICSSTVNPCVYLGSMGTVGASNNNIYLNPVGNVGIGTIRPLSNLHVAGTVLVDGFAQFSQDIDVNGNVYIDGNNYVAGNEITGLMNTNTSDRRLKKDFEKINDALYKVKSLTGYTFARVEERYGSQRFTGLIAQEVAEVLPEAVVEYKESTNANANANDALQDDMYLSLAYGNMMGLIVEAIKELSDEVTSLRQLIQK